MTSSDRTRPAVDTARRTLVSGLLFGAGSAALVVDLLVFHLLLRWHHFYDRSTLDAALVADGLLHAVGWCVTVVGLFLLADVRRRVEVDRTRWTGALLTGLGAFQLFDGTVNHKLLRLHQVRYDVDLLWYDVAWLGSAVLLLVVGLLVLRRAGRR